MFRMSDLGLRISAAFRRTAPDPFVIAILLTALTAALALLFGIYPDDADGLAGRAAVLIDAWGAEGGLWTLLAFGMQMCLILVSGHALASAPPVRRLIERLASAPGSTASAAALVGVVAAVAGLINWGLGLITGALLAREVGRAFERRGVAAHYPLICAAGYMGLLVWHGGLSGSAPLAMTTEDGALKVLPAEFVAQSGPVPLTETIFSGANLIITGGLLVLIPVLLSLLAPKRAEQIITARAFDVAEPESSRLADPDGAAGPLPAWLERSPIVAWLLATALLVAFFRYGYISGTVESVERSAAASTIAGLKNIGLNEINVAMIALGLILHASPIGYMRSIEEGARGCAGIIIQFPLYAGIMAMMTASGLVTRIAQGFNALGDETTLPILSFLSAGLVNLFVPSGGGQWAVQGPIALEAGLGEGVSPGRMILSVAYGDQLTNMLQPFWALPLLAITGVKARDIVGYTAIVMLAAGAWICFGLLVF